MIVIGQQNPGVEGRLGLSKSLVQERHEGIHSLWGGAQDGRVFITGPS
jgi:hypothetical protein